MLVVSSCRVWSSWDSNTPTIQTIGPPLCTVQEFHQNWVLAIQLVGLSVRLELVQYGSPKPRAPRSIALKEGTEIAGSILHRSVSGGSSMPMTGWVEFDIIRLAKTKGRVPGKNPKHVCSGQLPMCQRATDTRVMDENGGPTFQLRDRD